MENEMIVRGCDHPSVNGPYRIVMKFNDGTTGEWPIVVCSICGALLLDRVEADGDGS